MIRKWRRRLPHWELEGSYYYITFRLILGSLNDDEINIVKEHILSGHKQFYMLITVQVMPDHVHVIFRPNDEYSLDRIIKGIKGKSARLINKNRNSKGSIWMQEYFDRIIRTREDLLEKIKYMYENPSKEGLTNNPDSYAGWCIAEK